MRRLSMIDIDEQVVFIKKDICYATNARIGSKGKILMRSFSWVYPGTHSYLVDFGIYQDWLHETQIKKEK